MRRAGSCPPNVPTLRELPTLENAAAPQVGVQLGSHHGKWSGAPSSYQYQWLRCDASGDNCTEATPYRAWSTYTPVASDSGSTQRVSVIATNATGDSAPALSDPSGVVSG